ncbi:MAG: N-6 DNA methylase [Lachnospiraceae bacterium]|nr:N-6 DNA methylase [Lachnospiraceae bacterium]
MEYSVVNVKEKPDKAPEKFCVYLINEEEYIFCPIRNRLYKAKPEEKVRQWWIYRLKEVYGYSFSQIEVEVKVRVGSTEAKKRADIVVYKDEKKKIPRIFIEVKKPERKDGIEQLKVYQNATGCRLGLWSNGMPPHVYLLRMEPKDGEEEATWRELRNIPGKNEKLADVDCPITRKELESLTDFLSIVRDCEDHIKAHEGTNAFDEIFKLIITKLYDEKANLKNDDSSAQFRVGIFEAQEDVRKRIDKLFEHAKIRWKGVFQDNEVIQLTDESLAYCVSALQRAYLLKSPADILGAAFEVMVNPDMKGDKGQYFTPRHVVKMCIDVLKPQDGESVFDPACGSGGFLIGAMDYVYKQIERERDNENEIIENKKDYASEYVYGMDYDRTIAKVAKAYMLIWGDGRSNIVACDSLNATAWDMDTLAKFTIGSGTEMKLRQFDIIATNPPFAGDIATDDTLSQYELAFKGDKNGHRKRQNKMAKEKLFIERCINMLTPGGRMAIVLPRGILKNYSDENVRRYIMRNAKILGVVGLGGNMFKPFTNTKTLVMFLQKRMVPLLEDSEIDLMDEICKTAFCVTEKPGKDRTGKMIVDKDGEIISDLDEIAEFLSDNITFMTNEELIEEHEKTKNVKSIRSEE